MPIRNKNRINSASLLEGQIHHPSHTLLESAIFSELAVYLKADGWRIPGVLGSTPLAAYFADAWSAQTGLSKEPGVRQRTFWLRQVVNHGEASGSLRLASTTDLDLLSEWMYGFHCEVWADTVPQDLVLQRGVVEKLIGQKALYIWQDEQPVSMAAQTRASTNGIAINAVFTPLEQRGKGYATACVAALSQRLLTGGRHFCTLFTDLANPTSNRIYQRIGFEALGDFEEWVFLAE